MVNIDTNTEDLKMRILNIIIVFALTLSVSVTAFAHNPNAIAAPGTVALTFDDGPSGIYTQKILAVLKQYNVKATFFMVGENAAKHPDVVKMVDADGHAIGNHTWDHPFMTHQTDNELNSEIEQTQTTIYNIIGKKPVCLRYPYDDFNKHVTGVIHAHGLQAVGIDVDSEDYRKPGVPTIVNNVMKYVKSGVVILFHDGPTDRQETVDALPLIIQAIQKKGLTFSQICLEPTPATTTQTPN